MMFYQRFDITIIILRIKDKKYVIVSFAIRRQYDPTYVHTYRVHSGKIEETEFYDIEYSIMIPWQQKQKENN